jgi:hypothetical protein
MEFLAKMKNSSLFLDYVNNILKTFYQFDLTSFKKSYILFYLKKFNKTSTLPKKMITREHVDDITIYKAYNYHDIHIGKLFDL